MSLSLSSVRRRLYHNLFDLTTRSGRRFEGLCALFALLSVLVIFVESGVGTEYHLTFDEWHIFVWLELCVTLIFTGEYLLRLFSWPEPAKYVFSFWGFIDLVTILPLYVMWLWPEISLNYMFAWRAMRAIRVLRILKLLRFMPSLRVFWSAIISARHQLILFYSFIAIVMIIFGALMYLIEGPKYGFTTLNASVYWAIVTVTTVGYGAYAAGTYCRVGAYFDWLFGDCDSYRTDYHAHEQRVSKTSLAAKMSAVPAKPA